MLISLFQTSMLMLCSARHVHVVHLFVWCRCSKCLHTVVSVSVLKQFMYAVLLWMLLFSSVADRSLWYDWIHCVNWNFCAFHAGWKDRRLVVTRNTAICPGVSFHRRRVLRVFQSRRNNSLLIYWASFPHVNILYCQHSDCEFVKFTYAGHFLSYWSSLSVTLFRCDDNVNVL